MKILAVILLLCSTADAQVYRLRMTNCANGRCVAVSYCSGVCVGEWHQGQAVLLSCHHCFDAGDKIEVSANRRFIEARVVATDRNSDLAILVCNGSVPKCLPIASQDARVGDVVEMYGYPNGREFRQQTGNVLESPYPQARMVANRIATQGDSGGAFVVDGEVAGIISSYATDRFNRPMHSLGASATQIKALFRVNDWPLPRCGGFEEPVPQTSPPAATLPSPEVITQRGPPGPAGRDGKNGLPGPQGPPGKDAVVDYNRLEGWISQEIDRRVAEIPPSNLENNPVLLALRQRITDLESRPTADAEIAALRERIASLEKRTTVVLPASPEPRDITIKVVDENGKTITVPVTVPPDKSKVTIPIQRVTGG